MRSFLSRHCHSPISRRAAAILVVMACVMTSLRAYAQEDDLITASYKGDLPRVKVLLAAKTDVNTRGNQGVTALIAASGMGVIQRIG